MTAPRRRRLALTIRLAVVSALPILLAVAPQPAPAQPPVQGEWSDVFDTQNVMIHASLLPNGQVLFWSRREAGQTLDERNCIPRLWDPKSRLVTQLPSPGYNLFCSGQSLLPDGRVFVAGGHRGGDLRGERHASIFDPGSNTWVKTADMNAGRWYPTVVSLSDGGVLAIFGTDENTNPNTIPQVWKDGKWRDIVNFNVPPLYPRMHVVPSGSVFMTGPLPLTQFLNTDGPGNWTFLVPGDPSKSSRLNMNREYAPSVLYDEDKVVFIGGGLGDNGPPTKEVEIVDLKAADQGWKRTDDMRFARRQHNATLLPDGTVVVMGGTQGTGFNNLMPGNPIHSAELWNPKTGHWTTMARAAVDRCYHSIAVLLPDATVLSAGGGEFHPNGPSDPGNDPKDTHKDAQIFSPPYLFRSDGRRADRPDITSAPGEVTYGEAFTVGTSHPADVSQVNWVRLSSVTHSFNTNQRINFLKFTAESGGLKVTAPANANLCPPGHYMLFALDKDNVPSVAKTIRIHP